MKKLYSISETSKLTGLSASILRIWQLRYRWPTPDRSRNNYRKYTGNQIKDLLWVKSQIELGKSISVLIEDGKLIKPIDNANLKHNFNSNFDFSNIPLPKTKEGLRIRCALETAIKTGNIGLRKKIESEAIYLRPEEREFAVIQLLKQLK